MIHLHSYAILKSLFRIKDGNQIYEEKEYNHYFLSALRTFYPDIDEYWRVAFTAHPTIKSMEARKKIGEIFLEVGNALMKEVDE
jgi:hypothetical protein